MTKRKSTPKDLLAAMTDAAPKKPLPVNPDLIDVVIEGTVAPQAVALLDQMIVAQQALYTAAKAGESVPVPDVLARACVGTDDVLLVVWRAWDIYATPTDTGWMTRADQVR